MKYPFSLLITLPFAASAACYTQEAGLGMSYTDCDNGVSYSSQRMDDTTFHDFDNGRQAITDHYGDSNGLGDFNITTFGEPEPASSPSFKYQWMSR